MLTYVPGGTVAHRLDARAKLLFQIGFAVAAFGHPTSARLAVLGVLAGVVLLAGRLSPVTIVRSYWFVFLVLLVSPASALVSLGPPWIEFARARDPLLAVTRVVLVISVSAVYVRTTPVRATRAVIQRHVPGRLGQSLGAGIAITFRFLPVLRRDLLSIRDAIRARGGDRRPVTERARYIAIGGLGRAFDRADRLSLALQARCFAWNPTPPAMTISRRDYPVIALGVVLAISPLL